MGKKNLDYVCIPRDEYDELVELLSGYRENERYFVGLVKEFKNGRNEK